MRALRVCGVWLVAGGCAAEGFPAGAWRLAEWSVSVGDAAAPSFEATLEDAGTAVFEGDGTWWESVAYVELPLYVEEPAPQVVQQHSWVYWALESGDGSFLPELWLAWYQAYGTPVGVIALTERRSDRMVGDAAYQLGSSSVGLTDVRTHWVFEREAP